MASLTGLVDVNRHGLRSLQLGLLARWSELPGTNYLFSWHAPNNVAAGAPVANQSQQVEYAVKAVENGGTAIGIRCKDGVVLAVEKIITSKLLKPGANKKIATVDRHVGIVSPATLPKTCVCHCLINLLPNRYRLVSSPMVVISFPGPEMKHPRGEVYTKAPSQSPHSQIALGVTYKRTHFTPAYDHSA